MWYDRLCVPRDEKILQEMRRAKKLQQTLYTYIQVMVSLSKKILEDVGDLPYMLCKVELQERDALNAL